MILSACPAAERLVVEVPADKFDVAVMALVAAVAVLVIVALAPAAAKRGRA